MTIEVKNISMLEYDRNDILYLEIIRLQQENNQLKEQLKGYKQENTILFNSIETLQKKYRDLIIKQKDHDRKFMNWLNKEIKICHDVYKEYGKGNINEYYLAAFKLALEKYQNITKGNKHE